MSWNWKAKSSIPRLLWDCGSGYNLGSAVRSPCMKSKRQNEAEAIFLQWYCLTSTHWQMWQQQPSPTGSCIWGGYGAARVVTVLFLVVSWPLYHNHCSVNMKPDDQPEDLLTFLQPCRWFCKAPNFLYFILFCLTCLPWFLFLALNPEWYITQVKSTGLAKPGSGPIFFTKTSLKMVWI